MDKFINRELGNTIRKYLFKGKVIILYGQRQTGKTTLINNILKHLKKKSSILSGDDYDTIELFDRPNATKMKPIIGDADIIVIDEAQQIPDIGRALKIIYDNYKKVQIIATGSSSFDIANILNEPLTGRKLEFNLYPLSFEEMSKHNGFLNEKRLLEHRLIFGYYPDVVNNMGMERKILESLAQSYLYKDILKIGGIKKPVLLDKIMRALALQLGSEVNYNELSNLVGADKNTIERYIDLLEKSFVIFKLPAFNKNVRNEIKKGRKIYFYDNGIRNAIIKNYSPIKNRNDKGALWENFVISERKKYLNNKDISREMYFWRTTQQQEVDLIEIEDDKLDVYEIKYNTAKKASLSKTFTKAYKVNSFRVVSPEDFEGVFI